MKAITTDLEERQIADLNKITTPRVTKAEHIRRAIDMYLSTPTIQRELATARKD